MHFLVMTALGLILLVFAIILIKYGRASLHWKVVEGEVISTNHIVEVGGSNSLHKTNKLVVEYRYEANGNKHDNDTINFKWTKPNVASERKKYFVGKKLDVYMNPVDERQSVLEPGIDISNYIAIFSAIFFILAGIWLAIYV